MACCVLESFTVRIAERQAAGLSLNRESERIPRRLLRGKRANHKKDRIPYGRRSLQLAAGVFKP